MSTQQDPRERRIQELVRDIESTQDEWLSEGHPKEREFSRYGLLKDRIVSELESVNRGDTSWSDVVQVLEDAVDEFEKEHPRMTMRLKQAIETIANAGI